MKLMMWVIVVGILVYVWVATTPKQAEARIIGAVYQESESDWTNVWSKPTKTITDRKKIGEYDCGARIRVYAIRNGFGKVRYKGKTGWINMAGKEVVKTGWVKIDGRWKKVRLSKRDE